MDMRHMLQADHANIRQLADQIEGAVGTDGVGGRKALLSQLESELERHVSIVEQVIRPALRQAGASMPAGEHERHRGLLDQLRTLSGSIESPDWAGQFDRFREELDRLFAAHSELIGSLPPGVDEQRLAAEYRQAKLAALKDSPYLASGRRKRLLRIAAPALAVIGAAAFALLRRRRSQASADAGFSQGDGGQHARGDREQRFG